MNQAFTAMARLGALVADPGVRAQPVDVRDVAARLVTLVERGPGGRVEEIGGPQVLSMAEAATQWLCARDSRRPVLRVRVPGGPGRAFRAGHLTTSEGATGMIRWADYLAGQ
ncbi:hypothetical protein AB0C18_27480 [Nonomuraea muscovyensis]|uniref:hypothetical protein n=1 Tax=Nonomuraea muscovyensis TaxID=1124761 RepID=UPI0033C64DEE